MTTTDNTGDSLVDIVQAVARKQMGNPWVVLNTWTGTVL